MLLPALLLGLAVVAVGVRWAWLGGAPSANRVWVPRLRPAPPLTCSWTAAVTALALVGVCTTAGVAVGLVVESGRRVLDALELAAASGGSTSNVDTNTVRETFHDDVTAASLWVCFVIVCVAALLVEGQLYLQRPLPVMADAIAKAAELKFTSHPARGDPDRPWRITDFNRLDDSIAYLCETLATVRPYIPAALFTTNGVDEGIPGLATGYATLVFTDIVSSTNCWEMRPHEMRCVLDVHNSIMREAIARYDGYEVKTVGDAFIVAFARSLDALNFGIAVQLGLYRAEWPEEILELSQCSRGEGWNGPRIRVGINTGDVDVQCNPVLNRYDYFGPTVNKAARAESSGIVGTVCATTAAVEDARLDEDEGGASTEVNLEHSVLWYTATVAMKGVSSDVMLNIILPVELRLRDRDVLMDIQAKAAGIYSSPTGVRRTLPASPRMSPHGALAQRVLRPSPLSTQSPEVQESPCSERVTSAVQSPDTLLSSGSGPFVIKASPLHKPAAWGEGGSANGSPQRRPSLARSPAAMVTVSCATVAKVFISVGMRDLSSCVGEVTTRLSRVLGLASRMDAMLLGIESSSVRVVWNVRKPVRKHTQRALRMCRMLNSTVDDHATFHTGVAVGEGMYGSIAVRREHFLTLLGGVVVLSDALCATAAGLGTACLSASMPNIDHLRVPLHDGMLLRPIDSWGVMGTPHAVVVYELGDITSCIDDWCTVSSLAPSTRTVSHRPPDQPSRLVARPNPAPSPDTALMKVLDMDNTDDYAAGRRARQTSSSTLNDSICSTATSLRIDASSRRSMTRSFASQPSQLPSPLTPDDALPSNRQRVDVASRNPLLSHGRSADNIQLSPIIRTNASVVPAPAPVIVDIPDEREASSKLTPMLGPESCTDDVQAPWPWSDMYASAFHSGDYTKILQRADGDHVLQMVARNLRAGTHFQVALCLK